MRFSWTYVAVNCNSLFRISASVPRRLHGLPPRAPWLLSERSWPSGQDTGTLRSGQLLRLCGWVASDSLGSLSKINCWSPRSCLLSQPRLAQLGACCALGRWKEVGPLPSKFRCHHVVSTSTEPWGTSGAGGRLGGSGPGLRAHGQLQSFCLGSFEVHVSGQNPDCVGP